MARRRRVFQLRVTAEEKTEFKARAAGMGLTVSDLARQILLGPEVGEGAYKPRRVVEPELDQPRGPFLLGWSIEED